MTGELAARARADWLRLAGQRHSGDHEGLEAALASLAQSPGMYATAILRAALDDYLTALRTMNPDPAQVQAWLDTAGMEALDRLRR